MNTTISDAAVSAACMVVYSNYVGGKRDYRQQCDEEMRDALEAALPHLKRAKPEAVRLRDELRERAEFEVWITKSYPDRDLELSDDGTYAYAFAGLVWEAWQAALAATGKQQVGYQSKYLDLLAEVLDAKETMRAAGIEQADFPKMLAEFAARQPVGQEPVDIEAALIAGDPNWQEQCRPNLRGNERLFFAVRDIAEMRAMLAGEKKPLPGSGLAVVRVNPNAPSLVPYQCAHRLLGDAYQAGEQGTGYCDQAEELFVARTAHAKKESVAVVYAAPPAQAVDLGKLHELAARFDGYGDEEIGDAYSGPYRQCALELRAILDSAPAVQP